MPNNQPEYDARTLAELERFGFDDPWPERVSFSDDGDFGNWLARIGTENRLKSPVQPCVRDRVLVCSTCSMDPDLPDHYALFAVVL